MGCWETVIVKHVTDDALTSPVTDPSAVSRISGPYPFLRGGNSLFIGDSL
jgi:hypothetical protein